MVKKRLWPYCDYKGVCVNKAFREVFPSLLGGKHSNRGWRYLCRRHFYQEQRHYHKNKQELPWSYITKKIHIIRRKT